MIVRLLVISGATSNQFSSRRKPALLCGTHLSDSFTDPAPSRFGATKDTNFALDSG